MKLFRTIRSGVIGLGRRGFANSLHDIVQVIRVGSNCFFDYNAFGGGSAYAGRFQVASRRLPNGNPAPSQAYHFQQGDIVRLGLELHSFAADQTDMNHPLIVTLIAHRFNQRLQHLESILFNDTGQTQDSRWKCYSKSKSIIPQSRFL